MPLPAKVAGISKVIHRSTADLEMRGVPNSGYKAWFLATQAQQCRRKTAAQSLVTVRSLEE